jgi:putative DNA primase/helicase
LNWALDGLDRLTATGRFTRPASTDEAIIALQDLASPVAAFVRDRCVRDLGGEVPCDDLYRAWKAWADDNGHKAGSTQTFGRNLRAVIPELRIARPRIGPNESRSASSEEWRCE